MRSFLTGAACAAVLLTAPAFAAEGLVRLPSADWTPELLEDLEAGLAALPPPLRRFPGGPLELQLHEEASAWGMGDAEHPAFSDGLRRFHLYRFKRDEDPRALARLGVLPEEAQQRLWRRRAIVHAVIRRWDERLRWSARAAWQQLDGWGARTPWLVYAWAFSRKQGMESAALDLATFAEELLQPAESMAPDAVSPDERVRCRELSKSRYLDERIAALEPAWRPSRACPRFDAWAEPEHVSGFDVAFTAPATGGAQSLFGHLLLTIVRDATVVPGNEQVMELAALISPAEPGGLGYLAKGLTGGFYGIFTFSSLADVRHESLELEQRSIRRFRLDLNPAQRLRLLERMWDLERVGYLWYRFFDANCASMLRFLISPALGDAAPGNPVGPWESPIQVLDSLGPKLAVPEIDETSGDRARRVSGERRRMIAAASPATKEALAASWPTLEGLERADKASRIAGYQALEAARVDERWRARVLLASLRIERHALDVANLARLKTERSTVLPGWKGPTSAELISARQQRYEQEISPVRRARKELGDQIALDDLLRSAPRRELTPAELEVVAAEGDAREIFDAVAGAVGGLPEAELAAVLEEEKQTLQVRRDAANARAVPESGYGRIYLGAGVAESGTPLLRVRAAVLVEELGDQRLHGFGPHTEVHLFEGQIDLAQPPSPIIQSGQITLLAIRGLRDSGWGWGGGLDYLYLRGAHEVAAELDRLWVFFGDEALTNLLISSVGVRVGGRADPQGSAVFYPQVKLASRIQLPGSYGNAVRLEAEYAPRLGLNERGARFDQRVVGRARTSLRIGAVKGIAFTARADFEIEWILDAPLRAVGTLGLEID